MNISIKLEEVINSPQCSNMFVGREVDETDPCRPTKMCCKR